MFRVTIWSDLVADTMPFVTWVAITFSGVIIAGLNIGLIIIWNDIAANITVSTLIQNVMQIMQNDTTIEPEVPKAPVGVPEPTP